MSLNWSKTDNFVYNLILRNLSKFFIRNEWNVDQFVKWNVWSNNFGLPVRLMKIKLNDGLDLFSLSINIQIDFWDLKLI